MKKPIVLGLFVVLYFWILTMNTHIPLLYPIINTKCNRLSVVFDVLCFYRDIRVAGELCSFAAFFTLNGHF